MTEVTYSDLEAEAKMGKEPKFPVMEIFGPTLQGEGQMIGYQTLFIRFGGCDYKCKMCDSLHAVIPSEIKKGARWLTANEIVAEVASVAKYCRIITFSGGNPCMWDLSGVVVALRRAGFRIAVETQGTIFQSWLRGCDWITVSPKGPGMGEKFEPQKFTYFFQQLSNLHQPQNIALKVVIFDQQDIEFAKAIVDMTEGSIPFYLSLGNPYPPNNPNASSKGSHLAGGGDEMVTNLLGRMRILFDAIKQEHKLAEAIFLPQMHVLLWGNELGR